jgi:16S rRNA (cytosine967-C5)-methyltransferase
LRRFLREREDLVAETDSDPQARWNHPRWWVARVQDEYPEDWQQLLDMAQQAAPMSLRVDTRHHSVAAYQAQLQALGLGAKAVGASGLQLERAVPVHQLPGFDLGHVSVQDAAAQVAAPLLLQGLDEDQPWRILDACAAPGGKTGHLLACYPNAKVLALDVDALRCRRIEDNLKRLGEQAQARAQVTAANAAHPEKWWNGVAFDAILLDAPCTASGIVRRHPDVRWLRRPGDSAQLAQTQAQRPNALLHLLCFPFGGRRHRASVSSAQHRCANAALPRAFDTRQNTHGPSSQAQCTG